MKKIKTIFTFPKKKTGHMTSDEIKDWEQWLQESPENLKEVEDLETIWQNSGRYRLDYSPDVEAGLSKLKGRIRLPTAVASATGTIGRSKSMRQWWRIAAAFLVLVVAGFGANRFLRFGESTNVSATTSDKMTKEIALVDGTHVVLNENSSLTFPRNFGDKERHVFLKGEGFFNVVKNASKPFIVETTQSKVEVLGTSFNFRAYANESFHEVLVKSGKVVFSDKNGEDRKEVSIGEKAILDLNKNKIQALADKSLNALSWRTKKLTFRSDPLYTVFSEMERYYKIEIKVDDPSILKCTCTSTLEQKKLGETIRVLELLFELRFEKLSNRIYRVKGGNCSSQ